MVALQDCKVELREFSDCPQWPVYCLAFREQQNNSNQELSRAAKNILRFTTLPSKLFV
jgi:hypothetical protein